MRLVVRADPADSRDCLTRRNRWGCDRCRGASRKKCLRREESWRKALLVLSSQYAHQVSLSTLENNVSNQVELAEIQEYSWHPHSLPRAWKCCCILEGSKGPLADDVSLGALIAGFESPGHSLDSLTCLPTPSEECGTIALCILPSAVSSDSRSTAKLILAHPNSFPGGWKLLPAATSTPCRLNVATISCSSEGEFALGASLAKTESPAYEGTYCISWALRNRSIMVYASDKRWAFVEMMRGS